METVTITVSKKMQEKISTMYRKAKDLCDKQKGYWLEKKKGFFGGTYYVPREELIAATNKTYGFYCQTVGFIGGVTVAGGLDERGEALKTMHHLLLVSDTITIGQSCSFVFDEIQKGDQ